MADNRSFEMSVGMLSPSSAGEVCGADAGRYNAAEVLPQGAFYVQSIRTAQTANPRAKQTRPSGPTPRSARVNSRPGDGNSPGSMRAVRFHLGEVVESFLGPPLLAGLAPLADGSGSQWDGTGNLRRSPRAEERIATVFAEASWQRCRTHFMADLLTRVPSVPNPAWPPWRAPSTSNSRQKKSTHRRTG